MKRFLCCWSTRRVQPASQLTPDLLAQIDKLIEDYSAFINTILTNEINYLDPTILDTVHRNKAHCKGLINEIYVKYNGQIAYLYSTRFDHLDIVLHSAIRRQYRKGNLRIPSNLMKRHDIMEILHTKGKSSFSAEF